MKLYEIKSSGLNVSAIDVSSFSIDGIKKEILCNLNQKQIEELFTNHHITFNGKKGNKAKFDRWDDANDAAWYTYIDEENLTTEFVVFINEDGVFQLELDDNQE